MSFWPEIAEPIIGLSPMDGVTDASFRYMAAKHGGPDVTFTEFVNIQSALYSPQTLLRDFGYSELERPIVAQVYGKTPELFYKVAHVVCELGFDGLDINMGCPAKKVAASGCGAALIRTPDLAREIIRAAQRGIKDWQGGQTLSALGFGQDLIEQIDATKRQRSRTPPLERRLIPLSVKTRLGYDRDVVETWLSTLLSERPAAISLHGRTLQQGYKGEADWQAIGRAVRGAEGSNAKIIGNGDVHTLQEAYRRVRETGVDGVLIGRGAQGDPWLFREKEALKRALRDGGEVVSAAAPVALTERFRVMIEHSEHFECLNGAARFVAMRKHLTWYCRNFRGAAEMRARMTRAESAADVRRCAAEFMPSALDGLTGMIHWHAKHPDLPELPADVADSSCA
jgi:nifR3 family TIM-barrel protein